MSAEWLLAGTYYKCNVHDIHYPRGAWCPACGEPIPEPTLKDIKIQLNKIEKMIGELSAD